MLPPQPALGNIPYADWCKSKSARTQKRMKQIMIENDTHHTCGELCGSTLLFAFILAVKNQSGRIVLKSSQIQSLTDKLCNHIKCIQHEKIISTN